MNEQTNQKRITVDRNIKQDRKTGTYYVTLYYGSENGKAKRQTVTCKKLTDAQSIRNKHEYECSQALKSSINPQMTVGMCVEEYISKRVLSPTTITGYNNILKRLKTTALYNKKMVSVKKRDIQNYIDYLRNKGTYKYKTINGDRQLLNAVFNYAIDYEYITVNEVAKTSKLHEDPFHGRVLCKEDVEKFLNELESSESEQILVSVCLGLQGLRRGEIAGLKWENISFEQNTISIIESREPTQGGGVISKKPKTVSSIRKIPLFSYAKKHLLVYQQYQKDNGIYGEYVIVTERGKPIYPQQINNTFNRILKKHGLEHIRLHDLRHTCCTLLIDNGATLADTAKYLGHSSSRVTESIYTHLGDKSVKRAGDVLENIFRDLPK